MTSPSVFVCLATYEPSEALLDRQLASLSAQTYTAWTGVVVDDASSAYAQAALKARVAREPRLRVVLGDRRLGFYRNFERALQLVPDDARYVALCDQDDHWWPEKLEREIDALRRSGSSLVYSDLRIVERDGTVRSETYWSGRPHDQSLRGLVYNNVATGATILFRRELLQIALPFPADSRRAFHDHWLALCAAADAGLEYLDEPLVDYTQHDQNVIGASGLRDVGPLAELRLAARSLREIAIQPFAFVDRLDEIAGFTEETCERLEAWAATLAARVDSLPPELAEALRPFRAASRTRRFLDLLGPTTLSARWAGEQTNLDPLKLCVGLVWGRLRRS